MQKKQILLVVGIFVLIFGLFYNAKISRAKINKGTEYRVKRETLKETLSISGKIAAAHQASLAFQSSGKIAAVNVKEGDMVTQNQLLASLDQRQIQKTLKKYLNTFDKVRWDLDTTRENNDEMDIGKLTDEQRRQALRVIDKAQFDVNNAVLDVEIQNLALEYSNLYSPIQGIVTKVIPYTGQNITAGVTEFEVIDPDSVYFSAQADQTEVTELSETMNGDVTLDSFENTKLPSTITHIAFTPSTDESGTVYEVKMSLDSALKNKLRVGMTGDAEFVLRQRPNVLAIPSEYIETDKDTKYVKMQINDKESRVRVETGETVDDMTEIIKGLKVGDVIYN